MVPRQHFSVLCVDDSNGVLNFLKAAFDASGYDIEIAQNGFAALQKLNKDLNRFKLIITDLRMPGMDGFALIEQCRASGYVGPFVIYAASIGTEDRQRLGELRVNRVLDQPARAGELIDVVKEIQASY